MGANDREQNRRADKAAANKAKKADQDGWKGFVSLELNDQQKAEAKKLMIDHERTVDNVWALVDDGYKISVSYDAYHSAYVCAATCRDALSVNNGLTLTGRGGGILAAMASLWYKHDVVCGRNWTTHANASRGGMAVDELG